MKKIIVPILMLISVGIGVAGTLGVLTILKYDDVGVERLCKRVCHRAMDTAQALKRIAE